LKFFTNPYGKYPYHLIPYSIWRKGYSKPFKELIIDPGVNQLKNKIEYPYINEYPLKITQKNILWVIPDYPYDVGPNLTQRECVIKSWENIEKWYNLPQTICSVQYEYENIVEFIYNYDNLYFMNPNIIGIGNLCKSTNMEFLKNIIYYIQYHNPDKKRIHFFGLYKLAIKYLLSLNCPFEISIDSMKWDYGLHSNRVAGTETNTKKYRWKEGLEYINEVYKWDLFYKKQQKITKWL